MIKRLVPFLLSGFWVSAIAQSPSGNPLKVIGVGAFPISGEMSSLWLNGASGRPLVVIYFRGKDGWLNTKWDTNSKTEQNGWAGAHFSIYETKSLAEHRQPAARGSKLKIEPTICEYLFGSPCRRTPRESENHRSWHIRYADHWKRPFIISSTDQAPCPG